MSSEEMMAKMMDYLQTELRLDTDGIEPDTELVSTGVLDSTDLVRFSAFLERTFDIVIPDQDVSSDNFDTIAMSLRYVRKRLSP